MYLQLIQMGVNKMMFDIISCFKDVPTCFASNVPVNFNKNDIFVRLNDKFNLTCYSEF